MAIKTLRVFAEYTSTGFVPMPVAGGIDYGYTLANTFPSTQPSTFQTDDPDLDVTVTAMTDFYVWIRISGTAWNPSYTRNVRVYPDSPDINSVVMNMIIATGPAGVSSYSQIVQTANRLYFNGATTDSVYNSKFAGKTYINELNFGTAPQLATVATSGAYADLTGKPALATVATSGSYADLSSKPSGTAPISYNSGTNSFQITQANSTTNGFLTSTDWNTFNNKYLLPSGGTTAQYLRGDGTLATFPTTLDSTRLILNGRNTTGTTLTKGTVVYINGVSGNTPLFARAIASADSTSAQTLGVVEFDIPNNSNGVVVLVGAVNNLDTSSYTEGVQLYLSGTTAGAFTSSKILAPTHLVYVGIVTRAHPTLGVVEVKIQNGYELDEIHDVQISSPADKHILYYDNATTLWKHSSVASVLGFTPYNATNPSNYIALTALSASAPLSYNNTTGAFSIAQANGSTNGFLSSTDWTTFNSKQNALTLGNVSEVSSNVLMFPDGTTGKTIGNLSIQVVQAGATTNGYLSSTDWTTFNNKQGTITGGASTITTSDLTASRALTSNASGKVDVSTVTSTELGYLSGVTSAIQTQLNAKQNTITNAVTGTGTINNFAVWNTLSTISGSNLSQSSGSIVSSGGLILNSYNTAFDTQGSITRHSVVGLVLRGVTASSFDFAIYSASGNALITNPTGSNFINLNSGQLGINSSNITWFNNFRGLNLSNGSLVTYSTNGSIFLTQNAYFNASGSWTYLNAGTAGQYSIDGVGNHVFYRAVSGSAGASVSLLETMRITSAGNVGIGTGSPNHPLTVKADTSANGINIVSESGGYGQLSFSNSANSAINTAITQVPNGSNYDMYLSTFNGSSRVTRMVITGNGNIGINQSSPTAMLHLNSGSVKLQASSNSDKPYYEIINPTDQYNWARFGGGLMGSGQGYAYISCWNSGVSEIVRVNGNGNVSIYYAGDAGYRLYVSGTIYATSNITANSDLTLKKNLQLIENPIDKLMSLNGYLYQWKENDEYQYGVIAQEVEKVMSYAVQTGNNGIKGVAYNQLTPLLIEGFKLHNSEITQLKERVKYLEAKLA